MKITLLLATTLLFISCQKHDSTQTIVEGKYKVEFLNGNDSSDDSKTTLQLYIAGNDTLVNQSLNKKNGKINPIKSSYYDLDVKETENPGEYAATLTLYSDLINVKNIEFEFLEKKSGEQIISKVNTNVDNTLNFKYSNPDSHQLVGILKFSGDKKEIIDNQAQLFACDDYLLVDNFEKTNNIFLEKYKLLDKKRLNE